MAKLSSKNALKFSPAGQAILTTIIYSDIFSFPLTQEELWKWLISEEKITRDIFEEALRQLDKYIVQKDGYFCLKGREEILTRRIHNLSEVTKKMERVRDVVRKVSIIPSLLFIGVSGGLAAGNVSSADDIDLVIITKKNRLFITRFLIVCFLEVMGIRRSRKQKKAADTICVNLLFDEEGFNWFHNQKDLYTAREIAQILPLFERDNVYQHFMDANKWIKGFLPNVSEMSYMQKQGSIKIPHQVRDDKEERKFLYKIVFNFCTEAILRTLQMSFMKRHQTREMVTKHLLAFHPIDYKTKTLKNLRLKLRQFGLLTKF